MLKRRWPTKDDSERLTLADRSIACRCRRSSASMRSDRDKLSRCLRHTLCILLSCAQSACSLPAPASPPDQTGTIVHLFEWSWQDVATECEAFLGPHGFEAVQVSPPNEHIKGPHPSVCWPEVARRLHVVSAHGSSTPPQRPSGEEWWTRYQPVSYNLTSRSGQEEDFKKMIHRCSASGVKVYADAVVNHMAAPPEREEAEGVGGSRYRSRSFPLFEPADFHHLPDNLARNCDITDYKNRWNVQNCDLVGLADLDTGAAPVQARIASYIARLASLGVAGVRIDAAKHIPADDVAEILGRAALPENFVIYQEVIRGPEEPVQPGEYLGNGQVLEFGYTREVFDHFVKGGELQYLMGLGESWGLLPSETAVVFVDNHDLQRSGAGAVLTYKSGKPYDLALVYMLAYPYGTPRLMSSYYFDDPDQGPPSLPVHQDLVTEMTGAAVRCGEGEPWVCEHRRPAVAAMVGFRRAVGGEPVENAQALQGGDLIAFSRGAKGFVAINKGSDFHGRLQTGLPQGRYQNLLGHRAADVAVDSEGWADVRLDSLSAMALLATHTGRW